MFAGLWGCSPAQCDGALVNSGGLNSFKLEYRAYALSSKNMNLEFRVLAFCARGGPPRPVPYSSKNFNLEFSVLAFCVWGAPLGLCLKL